MAGGMDLGGGGKGKKPLDMAINLVPFIDLMAVTIVFLIMSAVWTQLGRLEVSQSGQSPQPVEPTSALQPITLLLTATQLRLTVGGATLDPIPVVRDAVGRIEVAALVARLKDLKSQQPEQTAITLSMEDEVKYADLIRLIDTVIREDTQTLFPSVSVAPASQ